MTKIIDRTGSGAAITQIENDANLDSLHGINQVVAGTTFTVDITDQGDTLEFTNAGSVAVTLDAIATIQAAAHTSDFRVVLINTGAGTVTITPDGADSINTGAATIVLTTDEYVEIQTDSTGAIWNILKSNVGLDVLLGSETLDVSTVTGGSYTFASIPEGTTRVKMSHYIANTSGGVGYMYAQIGDSTGFYTASYNSSEASITGASASSNNLTTGFKITGIVGTSGYSGVTNFKKNPANNQWIIDSMIASHSSTSVTISAGHSPTMTNVLSDIKLIKTGVANNWLGGSVLVEYFKG